MGNKYEDDQLWHKKSDDPFKLQELLGIEPRVRITTMAGPSMFLAKLDEIFGNAVKDSIREKNTNSCETSDSCAIDNTVGNHIEWPKFSGSDGQPAENIGHLMHAMVHEDLRNLQRLNYNEPLSLLELYSRAYENGKFKGTISQAEQNRTAHFVLAMCKAANASTKDLDAHPLIIELKDKIEAMHHDETGGAKTCTFEHFYPMWLESHTHDMKIAHKLFDILDTENNGCIDFTELIIACKWALTEFGCSIKCLSEMMMKVVEEWLIPEALIHELCVAPSRTNFKSESDDAVKVGPDGILTLTANTVRDAVLNSGKNVLVCFSYPPCPHCVEVKPSLKEVAAAMLNDDEVVVAMVDVGKNTVPDDFEYASVPTIYFKPAQGFAFRYRGLRDAESILRFVQDKRTELKS